MSYKSNYPVLVFADPFTYELQHFAQRLHRITDRTSHLKLSFKVIASINDVLIEIFQLNINPQLKTAELHDLLQAQIEPVFEKIALAEKRAKLAWRIESLANYAKDLRADLEKLKQFRDRFSTSHMLLQAHFYSYVLERSRQESSDNTEVADFLRPLYESRDNYFIAAQPQPGMIETYLDIAAELENTAYYQEKVWVQDKPAVEEKLKDLTSELLVHSFMG